jgi:hypothetical protein
LAESDLPYSSNVFPIHVLDNSALGNKLYYPNVCPGISKLILEDIKIKEYADLLKEFNNTYYSNFKNLQDLKNYDYLNIDVLHQLSDSFISDYTDNRDLKFLTDAGINYKLMRLLLKL